jgi:hypothetical protein
VQETKQNVRDLYEAEMKMSERDRWIFDTPLHTMLNRPIVHQAQWVAKYTDLIIQCVQEFEFRDNNNMMDLRNYYEPKPPGKQSPMRTPIPHKQTPLKKKLKAVSLVKFFESSISPGERTKRATRTKTAKDERKAHEKHRKAKQKNPGKSQPRLHGFFQPKELDTQNDRGTGRWRLVKSETDL